MRSGAELRLGSSSFLSPVGAFPGAGTYFFGWVKAGIWSVTVWRGG